jgi:hypothetical protein
VGAGVGVWGYDARLTKHARIRELLTLRSFGLEGFFVNEIASWIDFFESKIYRSAS